MRFAPLTFIACLAAAVAAQTNSGSNPNPFKVPPGFMLTAGQATTVQWTPTTQGTVTLTLRSGAASALNKGTVIASKISNSGSYSVNLPADTTRNSDYTLEISSDSDPTQVNYTPQFVVESKNTVASMTGSTTTASAMTMTNSAQSTMTSASAKSMASSSSSASSASSAMSSSSSMSSGTSKTTSSATGGSTAPSSGANVRNVLNVQGGVAAVLMGAVAIL